MRVVAAQAADELLAIQGVMVSFVIFPSGDLSAKDFRFVRFLPETLIEIEITHDHLSFPVFYLRA